MRRREFIRLAGMAAGSLLLQSCRAENVRNPSGKKRPNILFILTDDQGWADLSEPFDPTVDSAYCKTFRTPNMNRLAASAMRFTDAYSPAPLCTPTRRSIQFGMTPARQHATEFVGDFDPTGKWSIAQALKQVVPTYRCAHYGKWGGVITGTWTDYPSQYPGSPNVLGYDEHDSRTCNHSAGFYKGEDWARNTVCEPAEDPKQTFSLTDRGIAFMKKNAEQGNPFYLQVSYYAIHTAFQAKQETIDRYADTPESDRRLLPGVAPMLDDLDANVGRLVDAVKELGIADNTYIFFTSDNGGEDWNAYKNDPTKKGRNHPLRKYKQTLYEGGIRVPFWVMGPGIKAGTICRTPVAGYDLLPTFYDLAGGEKPIPQAVDGGTLRPLLKNECEGEVHRSVDGLVFHRPDGQYDRQGQSVYRQGNYKFILFWTQDGKISHRELYDLSKDLGEKNDLSKAMPDKADQMQKTLLDYLKTVQKK